jgi:hypothetical protein
MTNSKKDSLWLKHDSNAQDDPKCMLLIDQLQMEGYGIFWALNEKLRAEADHTLPLSVIPSFARRWGTTSEKVIAVIKNYELYEVSDDGRFYSNRLSNDMKIKSDNARKSLSYRYPDSDALRPYRDPNTDVSRTNTIRKEKNRKEKNRKGGVGEKVLSGDKTNTGAYFDLRPEKRSVRLEDGTEQRLGPKQYELAKQGKLSPQDVFEGDIH